MLKSLQLKFGRTPDHPPLDIPVGSAVVLVGPNNSGKSRLLQELEHFLKSGSRHNAEYFLLKDIEADVPVSPSLQRELVSRVKGDLPGVAFRNLGEELSLTVGPNGFDLDDFSKAMDMLSNGKLVLRPEHQFLIAKIKNDFNPLWALIQSFGALFDSNEIEKKVEEAIKTHEADVKQSFQDFVKTGIQLLADVRKIAHERNEEEAIIQVLRDGRIRVNPYLELLANKTLRLDGRQRLEHVRPTELPTQDASGNNPLTRLLREPSARQLLRDIVFDAFGLHLCLDVSSFQRTCIKLSNKPPEEHELAPLKPEAIAYFRSARNIEEFSDGVKSFIGLLSAVLSDEYLVMLVDEPEAFLHPPLAKRLGHALHQLSRSRNAHILAATHSADFLMGCIQAAPEVNIVRLTYRQGVPTARLLAVEELQRMMLDPLLRSTGTLSALFHEGAVVCEGDRDRAFYQEINERLLAQKEGADGCLFMNAHSKQAIRRVVGLLRRMGIPAAAIVDLDLILDENTLKELLAAIDADPATIKTLGATKGEFYRMFVDAAQGDKDKSKALLKSRGLNALNGKQKQSMMDLFFTPLAQLGIFVVPGGEVESWLSQLLPEGSRPSKQEWLNTIFEALGADPKAKYVQADTGDVWKFMRDVARWIDDPIRQGIPSF